MPAKNAVPKTTETNTETTMPINNQINVALAKFALLGLAPEPKPQTNSIMMLTRGMAKIKIVSTQSLVFTILELF